MTTVRHGRRPAAPPAAVVGRVHPDYRAPLIHLVGVDASRYIVSATAEDRARRVKRIRDSRIERAREEFPAFVEYCFWDERTGRPLQMQWFHDQWSAAMDTEDRLVIVAPRDHGKTTQVVARVLWELGRDPNLRIKIVCASDGKAIERLFEVTQQLENPRVREVFPGLAAADSGEWSKHKIVVKRTARHRDASVEALGITSTATGGRADLLIADDVVDRRNALSMPALREQIKHAWKSDWTNLLEPHGRIWYICTLWHKCLPADAPVATGAGIVAAGSVTPRTLLRVGPNRYEYPRAVTRRPYSGDLVSLRVGGLTRPLRCTGEHRWPTQRGDVAADDLRVGDWLRMDLDTPHAMADRDAIAVGPQPDTARVGRPVPSRTVPRRDGILEWVQTCIDEGMSYAEIGKRAGYRSGKSWVNELVRRHGLRPGDRGFRLRRAPGADLAFWRLCGYYCAEGDINADNRAVRLSFGHGPEERRFAKDAASCARSTLGVRAAVRTIPHGTLVQFSCRAFSDWCVATFGKLAENLRLPPWFVDLPRPMIDAWLLGYWNGDGTHSASLRTRAARFSTVSPHLAYALQRVLPSVYGEPTSVYVTPKGKDLDAYDVRCADAVLTAIGAAITPWRRTVRRAPRDLVVRDGAQWMRVKRIARERWDGDVVDIATSTGYFDVAGATTHNSDLSHELLGNAAFRKLFAAVPDDFGALWPDKWPESALRARHIEIGSVEFNRAFRNIASDVEEGLVKPGWIQYSDLSRLPAFDERLDELVFFTSYDTAVAVTDLNDYSASVTVAVDTATGAVYVVDAWHGRITVKQQAARVWEEYERFRPFRILIEKAGQSTLDEWVLNDHPDLAGIVEVTKPRVSKAARLLGVTPLLEAGRVTFSHHLDPNRPTYDPTRGSVVHELLDFPFGKNDDLVDSFSQALSGARRYFLDAWATGGDNVLDLRIGGEDEEEDGPYAF